MNQQQLQQYLSHKNQQQIEHTLQSSANALNAVQGENPTGSSAATNLNNSTTSSHMNVYKPTFIINNSYQPDSDSKEKGDKKDKSKEGGKSSK